MAKPAPQNPAQILVIQTAFIGDAILATAVLEKLHARFPHAAIDFLVRKGNESLFTGHPFLRKVLVRNKKLGKLKSLAQILKQIRSNRYDLLVNLHRFASSGMISWLSKARYRCGFAQNPFAWSYDFKVPHFIGTLPDSPHEIERNQSLIAQLTDPASAAPKLYPSPSDFATSKVEGRYICVAPTSVWFTKQWPAEKWGQLIARFDPSWTICILGAPSDRAACEAIAQASGHPRVQVRAGELSLLQSAALMQGAEMNYVNDSAPMHLCSAMDAPVTAIYCSTVPEFGFGPRSSSSFVWQTAEKLNCRPCGLHGFRACPKGHFRCAEVLQES